MTTDTAHHVDVPVRLAVDDLAPHVAKAMNAFEHASRQSKLEKPLQELVRLRASQLNGCAYCVDMHSHDARDGGESIQRLFAVAVWRETPFFTERERAALALTEAGTRLTDGPVTDEVFNQAAKHFDEVELAELIWQIAAINTWNRLGAIARPWPITVRPAEAQPIEVRPAEARPSDVRPAEARPSDVRPAEAQPSDVRP